MMVYTSLKQTLAYKYLLSHNTDSVAYLCPSAGLKFFFRPFLGAFVSIKVPVLGGSSAVVQPNSLGPGCCVRKEL